jgi:hypothetical protein
MRDIRELQLRTAGSKMRSTLEVQGIEDNAQHQHIAAKAAGKQGGVAQQQVVLVALG